MKLSIIIALYNTEEYIEKCIRSIYDKNSLSIDSFEVIVINDGSTDEGPYIVERLQKEFSNIQLINKENGGQSTARNIGFDVAKGEYIFCLDSDDFIEAEKMDQLLEVCHSFDLDLLGINFIRVSKSGDLLPRGKEYYSETPNVQTGGEFLNNYTIFGAMCMNFYRASIIKKNNLRLIEGIYHEDEEFVVQFLSHANRVKYVDVHFYNYLIRETSTVNAINIAHRTKLRNDIISVVKSLNNRLLTVEKDSLVYSGISKKKEQLLISVFLRMRNEKIPKKEVCKIINLLKSEKLYPLTIKYSNYKFRMAAILLNNSCFIKTIY